MNAYSITREDAGKDYRAIATPPTEEVAEPAATDAGHMTVDEAYHLSQNAEADPLNELITESLDELAEAFYKGKRLSRTVVREFAERVRALTTEDTVPAQSVRNLVETFRGDAHAYRNSSRTPAAHSVLESAAGNLESLLPKAGQ